MNQLRNHATVQRHQIIKPRGPAGYPDNSGHLDSDEIEFGKDVALPSAHASSGPHRISFLMLLVVLSVVSPIEEADWTCRSGLRARRAVQAAKVAVARAPP